MKSPLSLIQSIRIKLTVLSIAVALILWFGWAVPQADQQSVDASQFHNDSAGGEKAVISSSFDINQGTREQFQTLPGIGPVLADRIIDYRESIGNFVGIEDLKFINGIGERKLAQLKPYITVNPPSQGERRKGFSVTKK